MQRVWRLLLGLTATILLGELCPLVAQGYSPEEAVRRMTVAEGFDVSLVASEPLVRQPVCIEFDDRGRLWVIQYLQYPNPEGLKRVEVDRYSRTEYDRVPLPPPHGPSGNDRITILDDSDGDGRMDRGRDFVSGLNLASGIAFGHDGVFVLNVPYLLFYPDRNRDDVPDSDPEVLLNGFGMQDAHSVANSLTWGPDGWLYGCQGSTVTANVRGIEFQQGVWRYHPTSKEFELFCEGGGNSWGLDFDERGNLLYSTNYGGFVLLHGVQGGYYVKSFAKHGALHNPYTYGYFDHAPHTGFRGGHVTVGGIVYLGDTFPTKYRGKYIAGDLLGHSVYWHEINQMGSTVTTSHGGELLIANDSWFAPTDVTIGPDGAIYVADWHDARTAHPDPDADWDRSNGRIFRIAAKDTPPAVDIDFAKLSGDELIDHTGHRSQWHVRRARQELVRRGDLSVATRLTEAACNRDDHRLATEAIWTLMALGALDEPLAVTLLDSPHETVRYWALRFLGDTDNLSTDTAHRLDDFAEQEPDAWVRQQLACTAARLPAHQALPLINANILRDIDHEDPYLPLLWWWAVERHSITAREEVLRRFVRPSAWNSKLGREFLLPRLARRYAAEGTAEGYESVIRLRKSAPHANARDSLWEPILQGLQEAAQDADGIRLSVPGRELAEAVGERWQDHRDDLVLHRLAILLNDSQAVDSALATARDSATSSERRVSLLRALSLSDRPQLAAPLLEIVRADPDEEVRVAALNTLSGMRDARIAESLIGLHQTAASASLKSQIRDVLLTRRTSALAWLQAVDRGDLDASATPIEQIRRVTFLKDSELDRLVRKHWGRLEGTTPEEKLAEVRRLNNDLRAGTGDPAAGRELFSKHCATCHRLFGEGRGVGPDLTTANRSDRQALLVSLVDPNSVIRKEFVSLVVQTTDGRVLTGLPSRREGSELTLIDSKGEPVTVPVGEIEATAESKVSLMPENLYREFTPQQLRDLFAWLQSSGPPRRE